MSLTMHILDMVCNILCKGTCISNLVVLILKGLVLLRTYQDEMFSLYRLMTNMQCYSLEEWSHPPSWVWNGT